MKYTMPILCFLPPSYAAIREIFKKNQKESNIFSSADFGENLRYCYSLGVCVVVVMQKL